MSKAKKEAAQGANYDLLALAGELTAQATTTSRGGSSGVTYLDRFVSNLLDENGNPVEPKRRSDIINEIAVEMFVEIRESEISGGKKRKDGELIVAIDFTKNEDGVYNTPGDVEQFKKLAVKVKNQVAAAIARNQNSTSVSFNPKYKDIWEVAKFPGGLVTLAKVDESNQAQGVETTEESSEEAE